MQKKTQNNNLSFVDAFTFLKNDTSAWSPINILVLSD